MAGSKLFDSTLKFTNIYQHNHHYQYHQNSQTILHILLHLTHNTLHTPTYTNQWDHSSSTFISYYPSIYAYHVLIYFYSKQIQTIYMKFFQFNLNVILILAICSPRYLKFVKRVLFKNQIMNIKIYNLTLFYNVFFSLSSQSLPKFKFVIGNVLQ